MTGPVEADGAGGDDDVAGLDVGLDRPGRSGTQERVDAQLREFFDGDRRRRAADSRRADDHGGTPHRAANRCELASRREGDRVVEQFGNSGDPLRIPRNDRQGRAGDGSFGQPEMKDIGHVIDGSNNVTGGVRVRWGYPSD